MSGFRYPATTPSSIPNNGKLEVRAKGPNVTPGYWRQPELTAEAFDEEGFYKFGDALKPADPDDFDAGFDFDGRIAEDFKLASGTWVSVGPLRARFVAACAPLVRDVVIAGINRDEISALVVLDLDGCRLINPTLPPDDLAGDGRRSADPRRVSRALHEIPCDRDGLVDPDHPRGAARYAAVDRPRRSHRQGLDQPARGAGASQRADRDALFADAAGARDNALTEFEKQSRQGENHAVEGSGRHRHRWRIGTGRRDRAQARRAGRQSRGMRPQRQTRRKRRRRDQGRRGDLRRLRRRFGGSRHRQGRARRTARRACW